MNKMFFRPATLSDLKEIARLGEKFHAQAGWDEIAYNADDCEASLASLLPLDNFLCFVAEVDGEILGMIAGIMSPVYFNHSHLSGEELFWWVNDSAPMMTGIKLLKMIESAAKDCGCQTWQMKSLARLGGEKMIKLYERQGYRPSERSFLKELF